MCMVSLKFSLFLVYLSIVFSPTSVHSACNVCQENGVACVNATSFHMCFGDSKPHTDQVFTCKDGLDCTDLPNICFQSYAHPASCGDTSNCDVCNEKQVFACTSRTTFTFCFGTLVPSNTKGSCPKGKICDASTQDICVEKLNPDSIVCDKDAP